MIVLTSIDTGSGAAIIDSAKEAGVQVIEYDRFNTGSSGGAAYVSFDNVAVGATMAEVLEPIIDELPNDPKQVVMLNGGEEDNNAFLFRDGYNATVEKHVDDGSWALVADQFVPGWGANGEGQQIMEQVLTDANNKVDAVFAANDNLATQAINALEAAGVGPVPLSGQDATAAGIQQIILGKQTMTVYKPIQAEADVAAKAALALCAGEDPSTVESDFEFDDDRDHGRRRQARRLPDRRRRRPVPGADADRRDRRQHHGHRDRRRVPDDRGDLHRRHRGHGLLQGERLTRPSGREGAPPGAPCLPA